MSASSLGQLAQQPNKAVTGGQPIKTRKTRKKRGQVGPDQVVKAAAKLFREKGYHGTSMQDIGDAVGLQKGSLYPHVTSKDALLFQVINGALQTVMQQIVPIINSPSSPLEKLTEAIKDHIEGTIVYRDGIAVFLEASKYLSPARRRSALRQQRRYEALIQQIIEEGIEAGQFRPCDTKVVCYAILGMCNWVYRWYSPKGRLTKAELTQILTEFILSGIVLPVTD